MNKACPGGCTGISRAPLRQTDKGRSAGARVPPSTTWTSPRSSLGATGWVRIRSATSAKVGQNSTGVDKGTLLHDREGVLPTSLNSNPQSTSRTTDMHPIAQAQPRTAPALAERGVRRDPDSAHASQRHAERPLGG